MGIKECTYQDEHRIVYRSVESLYCTLETNITLYINYTGTKIKILTVKKIDRIF